MCTLTIPLSVYMCCLTLRCWHSGRKVYNTVFRHVFEGMGLTPAARVMVQHITTWDAELAMACVEHNAEGAETLPTLTYVGTGWLPQHLQICDNVKQAIQDELGGKIADGKYCVEGYDAKAQEPSQSAKRPALQDEQFKLTHPREGGKELALREDELNRIDALWGVDPVLKKQCDVIVKEFNKQHNPSEVPWKEGKRPMPLTAEPQPEEKTVFLKPCAMTLQELQNDGAHIFQHAANPKMNTTFKLIISQDGSKIFLYAESDGDLWGSLGRILGTFLQGKPAEIQMQSGAQWIEWKYESLDVTACASKKDASMTGPDLQPSFSSDPVPLKVFFKHLDDIGKARYNMVGHTLARDATGRITGVRPDQITCLPLPLQAPKGKALSLDNLAGYFDIKVVRKSKYLQIVHNLVCPPTLEHTHVKLYRFVSPLSLSQNGCKIVAIMWMRRHRKGLGQNGYIEMAA